MRRSSVQIIVCGGPEMIAASITRLYCTSGLFGGLWCFLSSLCGEQEKLYSVMCRSPLILRPDFWILSCDDPVETRALCFVSTRAGYLDKLGPGVSFRH